MIYMDNSATSYPKPKNVIEAVISSFENTPANPGRSSHKEAIRSASALLLAREEVAAFVNTVPENVMFTYNATYALNMAIFGTVGENCRVATTVFEHNSVLRPLYRLEREKGIEIVFLNSQTHDINGMVRDFEKRLKTSEKPDFLIMTHTSNVTGQKMPVAQLGRLCRENGVIFILDASQGLGYGRVDMERDGVDILCASGHKGLLGIMGSGFMAISKSSRAIPKPLITGGSGIMSFEKDMPDSFPERLEAGTVGMPGIESIRAGIEYVEEVTCQHIEERCRKLRERLVEGLSDIKGVTVYLPDADAVSIALFNIGSLACDDVSRLLDDAGICSRSGYHCAPLAHTFLQTDGAVRLSVSHFNTEEECDKVLFEVDKIAKSI